MCVLAAHILREGLLEEEDLRVALHSEPATHTQSTACQTACRRQQPRLYPRRSQPVGRAAGGGAAYTHFAADADSAVASTLANLTPVAASSLVPTSSHTGAKALQWPHCARRRRSGVSAGGAAADREARRWVAGSGQRPKTRGGEHAPTARRTRPSTGCRRPQSWRPSSRRSPSQPGRRRARRPRAAPRAPAGLASWSLFFCAIICMLDERQPQRARQRGSVALCVCWQAPRHRCGRRWVPSWTRRPASSPRWTPFACGSMRDSRRARVSVAAWCCACAGKRLAIQRGVKKRVGNGGNVPSTRLDPPPRSPPARIAVAALVSYSFCLDLQFKRCVIR